MEAANNMIIMEEVTDPVEIEQARARRRHADVNWDWFKLRAAAIYESNRGRFICVAGQEVFAADSVNEALNLATAAHPDDEGRFILYVPKEKMARIYAASRRVVCP